MICPGCGALVATSDEKCACGFPLRFPTESTPLDLGLVRDPGVDRRNDYALFFEEWCFQQTRPSPADILKATEP